MTDELADRLRDLEAERLRPVPPRPPARIHPDDLAELCDLLGDDETQEEE